MHLNYDYTGVKKEIQDLDKYLKSCTGPQKQEVEETFLHFGVDPGRNSSVTIANDFTFYFDLTLRVKVKIIKILKFC